MSALRRGIETTVCSHTGPAQARNDLLFRFGDCYE